MKSYLLTHNPNKFQWETIIEEYQNFKSGEEVIITWNTNNKKIKLGDRVFLMRLGEEPKGIYLSGIVTTECFNGVSWKDKSKTCTYIRFKLDKMVLPMKKNNKMFLIDDLKNLNSEYNWTPRSSGMSIPNNIAEELEKQWLNKEKNYKREVISIPAAETIDLIYKYKIYAHPIKSGYDYKRSLYYTFRSKLGIMEKMFMTKKTIDIYPYNIENLYKYNLNEDERRRVIGYISERKGTFGFESQELPYKIYILENEIDLPNKPKYPGQNNPTYFTLYELLSKEDGLEKSLLDIKYSEEDDEKNILIDEDIFEGSKVTVSVNKYERSKRARQACLNHYGYKCSVCGFDFEEVYGEVGKKVIEVHHLKPVYSIGKEYRVNPIKDLIPVCSNCHTIIHKRKIPFTIEEMKQKLKKDNNII